MFTIQKNYYSLSPLKKFKLSKIIKHNLTFLGYIYAIFERICK